MYFTTYSNLNEVLHVEGILYGSLTLTGLEGHICPSLVRDWKDIYVPLLWCHGGIIATSFRVSWTWWCNKNCYIVVRETWALDGWWINEENWLPWQIKDWFIKKKKKPPKSALFLGLVKLKSPVPNGLTRIRPILLANTFTIYRCNLSELSRRLLFWSS